MTREMVYFAQCVEQPGPIKIGVSKDPAARMVCINPFNPHPLQLLATFPGDKIVERRFHAAFEADHYHHEWFWPSQKLLETIALINQGLFRRVSLPKPKMLSHCLNGVAKPRGGWKWTERVAS